VVARDAPGELLDQLGDVGIGKRRGGLAIARTRARTSLGGASECALLEAGASMRDVVRVRYILPDAADFPATWPALRLAFGDIRPAATMIEARLADPRMKIEIEVDAIIGSA
jgi:hypothetical protein